MKDLNLRTTKGLIVLAMACLATTAGAHPYASGISNNNGTISWVLNETATDVKVLFDSGTTTVDYGATLAAGRNTFALGTHTNFAIVVYKVGANALTQISSDANPYNHFYGPRGVAVNRNPKGVNFGRIYVANANSGSAGPRGPTTKGLYVLDAASGDCLGQGNTAAANGYSFGTGSSGTSYSPFRVAIGPDDSVYVTDAASTQISALWVADANLTLFRNLFPLGTPYNNGTTYGLYYGRGIGTPNVTGSLAGGDLVVTLTMWDLNIGNPPGTYLPTKAEYNNLYRYNIGAGPLPYTRFPTVITNPIAIGNVNAVPMDAQIAPDGKIFITALRFSASDGTTNVCVLDSTGTQVLWDSKAQSASYFKDTFNDHVSMANYSIAVSPDDQYVLIQTRTNGYFMLMSLTNGIPDISTLTVNTGVGTGGGISCYAATWDAADNIYVSSGGSSTLRIFSPGLTTTCVTSNDWTGTNGTFQFTATSAALAALHSQPTNQTAQCSSNATFSVWASGAGLHYQWYQAGAGPLADATNAVLTLPAVCLGQSGTGYQLVVTNSLNSVTSQVAVLTVTDSLPPAVTLNGSATMAVLQGSPFLDPGATAVDGCAGTVAVRTNGLVEVTSPGTYTLYYVADDPSGNSATNTRTVIVQTTNGPPLIVQQPAPQVAQCTGPVSFNVIPAGAGPLSFQWYYGALPLTNGPGVAGATSATLTLSGVRLAQAGDYSVVITNSLGSITSQVASLTVNDTTQPTVTVLGSTVVSLPLGTAYVEAGATAADPCVGSLSAFTSGSVNVNVPGTYLLVYSATNATGQTACAQRRVTVTPAVGPVTAGTPAIIPLPVTQSNLPGVFTLCPTQPYPPAPGQALMRILVDAASQPTGQYLAAALARSTGYQFPLASSTATNAVRGAILITTANALSSLGAEGYELTVAPDSVVIRAPAQAGAFYGVQSLLQLLPPQIYSPRVVSSVAWVAPCAYIQDQPRFPWRGLMLDVSRHFFTKDEVKQLLDVMALHKLNTFHWHLTDDQGWRLEITNYPKLTSVGAWRAGAGYGLPPRASAATNAAGQYGGYYTQADAREVVAYAAERHITVVPEIELPCHVTAALAAYPELGCGNPVNAYNMDSINYNVDLLSLGTPATQAFVTNVLNEVLAIFPSPYIHCGGDEVVNSLDRQWNSYPPDVDLMASYGFGPNGTSSIMAYQWFFSYFVLSDYLQSRGRTMMGWTEIDDCCYLPGVALMDWRDGSGVTGNAVYAATNGQPVVMTLETSCYLNRIEGDSSSLNIEPPFAVGRAPLYLPLSQVYAFNPIPDQLSHSPYATNILGAQATLFTEYVPSFRNVQFKAFPRAAALAEIVWTPPALQSFSSFTNRLAAQEQRYAHGGVNFDRETLPQIGAWGPTVGSSATTTEYDITAYVTAAGELDVSFWHTGGAELSIASAALLVDGVQVDIDEHLGVAQPPSTYLSSSPYAPYFTLYVLHLPETKLGAKYTLRTVTWGNNGTTASGNIYLANWN